MRPELRDASEPSIPIDVLSDERTKRSRHVGDADPPASVCGATPLSGFTTAQLEFLVAHHLTDDQSEFSIRTTLRTPKELVTALRAAMAIAGHGDGAPPDNVERIAEALGAHRAADLRQACARLAGRDLERSVLRWTAAAELTAARTAFLVCNDLAATSLILRDLPASASGRSVPYVLDHLVRFSVSDPYFELLTALGSRP